MADYFVILKRAVSAIPDGGREQRQAIYDKARKALLAQLQNMDPPLAASEISKQRMALEEAVRSVERELDLAEQAKAAESEKADDASESSDASDAAKASEPPVVTATAPASQKPEPEKAISEPQQDKPAKAPAVTVSDKDSSPIEEMPADPVVKRAGPDVLKHAVRDANALGAATNAAVKSAQDAADAVGDGRDDKKAEESKRIEPTLGGVSKSPSETPKLEAKVEPKLDKPKDASAGPSFKDALEDETEPKSRLGWVVGGVLIAGLLGGSGYLLYENRDAFMGDDSNGGAVATKPATSEDSETVQKDREASAPASTETEIPAKTVRTVDIAAPSNSNNLVTPAQPASPSGNQPPADVPSSNEPVAITAPGSDTDTDAGNAPEGVTVAPRSILYEEEGKDGQPGSANPGEVLWALEGEGDNAEIQIAATIPNQNVTYSIKITKNKDAELPASHLIEISAERAATDDARAIVKIPGLILKPTEQSRGEGLVGAAIKISDNLHWIALTAGEKEEKYNQELLVLRSWIDIPIQYSSGVRAILTLEKGAVGDRVIEDAIKAWGGDA